MRKPANQWTSFQNFRNQFNIQSNVSPLIELINILLVLILNLLLVIYFIALYYRQLSVVIKMKNFKIKTRFVNPERPKVRANKTDTIFIIFILIFVENETIHKFSVWLRTGLIHWILLGFVAILENLLILL